jgi:hypothetical protein
MTAIATPLFGCAVHSPAPTATAPCPLKRQSFFSLLSRHHAVLKTIAHFRKHFSFFCKHLTKTVITVATDDTMRTGFIGHHSSSTVILTSSSSSAQSVIWPLLSMSSALSFAFS